MWNSREGDAWKFWHMQTRGMGQKFVDVLYGWPLGRNSITTNYTVNNNLNNKNSQKLIIMLWCWFFKNNADVRGQGKRLGAVGAESHNLTFSATFRTICCLPHIFAYFNIFRIISHKFIHLAYFRTIFNFVEGIILQENVFFTQIFPLVEVGKFWNSELGHLR